MSGEVVGGDPSQAWRLGMWGVGGVCGMRGVAGRCIDITQNADCEGSVPVDN